MRRRAGALLLGSGLLVGACSSGSAPEVQAPTSSTATPAPAVFPHDAAQGLLDRFVAASKAPGAIVGVSIGDGAATVLTSGVSDPRSREPMRADDTFYIASITKTFVGGLLRQLVDEGKVDFDAPINRFGLGFPGGDSITVRQLLTHTSGIPPLGGDSTRDQYADAFEALLVSDLHHRYTPEEIVDYVRARPALFPAGTSTAYSNINAILAGLIVEKVTGQDLARALRSRLFDPLKLTSTYYAATEALPREPVAGLFTLGDGEALLNSADFDHTATLTSSGAAGAMTSNAHDLLAWGRALLRDRSVSPATADEALAIRPGGTGIGVLGFSSHGFCVLSDAGCPPGTVFLRAGAAGGYPGVSTLLLYDRDLDVVLVVFANLQSAPGIEQLAIDLLSVIRASQTPDLPTAASEAVDVELAKRWWRWLASIPSGESPFADPDGRTCALAQPADVWFLAGTENGEATRTCSVPAGRPIFVPLANTLCRVDEAKPVDDQTAACAFKPALFASAALDGVPLPVERDMVTDPFAIEPTLHNDFFDGPFTAISSGAWVSLPPPAPGEHHLELRGGGEGGFEQHVVIELRVG